MKGFCIKTIVGLLCLFLLAGCSRTRLTATWKDPAYEGGVIHSILVLGISRNGTSRRTFEDEMTRQLRDLGIDAEASYRTIPGSELPDRDELERWIGQLQADGVIVSRLVDSRTERIVDPGYIYYDAPHYWRRSYHSRIDPFGGWYPYYRRSYQIAHGPPRVTEYDVYTVETTLYDLSMDQPVWSARADLIPDDDFNRMIEDFVDDLVDNMMEENLI